MCIGLVHGFLENRHQEDRLSANVPQFLLLILTILHYSTNPTEHCRGAKNLWQLWLAYAELQGDFSCYSLCSASARQTLLGDSCSFYLIPLSRTEIRTVFRRQPIKNVWASHLQHNISICCSHSRPSSFSVWCMASKSNARPNLSDALFALLHCPEVPLETCQRTFVNHFPFKQSDDFRFLPENHLKRDCV